MVALLGPDRVEWPRVNSVRTGFDARLRNNVGAESGGRPASGDAASCPIAHSLERPFIPQIDRSFPESTAPSRHGGTGAVLGPRQPVFKGEPV